MIDWFLFRVSKRSIHLYNQNDTAGDASSDRIVETNGSLGFNQDTSHRSTSEHTVLSRACSRKISLIYSIIPPSTLTEEFSDPSKSGTVSPSLN